MEAKSDIGGNYIIPADGYTLHNTVTGEYADKVYYKKTDTVTNWEQVSRSMIVKTDDELLEQFRSDIDSHVTIKRGTKKMTSTSVTYTFSYTLTGGCTITEEYS